MTTMSKTDAALMKLVFRVGRVGFSLVVEHLVEVIQLRADELDASGSDRGRADLGTFDFRNRSVPLVDLGRAFGLESAALPEDMAVLILAGEEGPWGALVGIVEGVFPDDSFATVDLPFSLICSGQKLYSQLDMWRGEPLVCLEPYKIDRLRTSGCL